MSRPARPLLALAAATLAVATTTAAVSATGAAPTRAPAPSSAERAGTSLTQHSAPGLRVATYNSSLNRTADGELIEDLSTPDDQQARNIAEVLQRIRPDVVLLNEFDYDAQHRAVDLFRENYLEIGQQGADPIRYRYAFVAPSNTGMPSGLDLNNDGSVGGPDDAFGFGLFEGQYGMAVLSRYPIATRQIRTFQNFLWKDMPGARLPDKPETERLGDWFTVRELRQVRLSSKSHWDVPVRVDGRTLHVLASHPTPPTFDGPEDRNGTRNHDEIRFWADYVSGPRGHYVYDDEGGQGGLAPGASFVILGDQNSDPADGDSVPGSIQQLLDLRRVQDPLPTSRGAVQAAREQGGANLAHRGPARYDTADFNDDPAPGNLRADYLLPSSDIRVDDAQVFWPRRQAPLWRLVGEFPFPTSDHRAVWADLRLRRR